MLKKTKKISDFRHNIVKRRRIGLAVVAGTVLAAVAGAWIWSEVNYNRIRRFSIYLEDGSQNISPGADLRFDGFKIGQVQSVALVRGKTPEGVPVDYARVILGVDAEAAAERFPFPREALTDSEMEKYIAERAAAGLRARITLPSLTAPGVIAELSFSPGKPARWSQGTDPDDPVEIPVMRSRSLQDFLDEIAQWLSEKKTDEIVEKIAAYSAMFDRVVAVLETVDYNELSRRINDSARALNRQEDVQKIMAKIREFNALLVELNAGFRAGTPVTDENFKKINDVLRDLREQTDSVIPVCDGIKEIIDALDFHEQIEDAGKKVRDLRENADKHRAGGNF